MSLYQFITHLALPSTLPTIGPNQRKALAFLVNYLTYIALHLLVKIGFTQLPPLMSQLFTCVISFISLHGVGTPRTALHSTHFKILFSIPHFNHSPHLAYKDVFFPSYYPFPLNNYFNNKCLKFLSQVLPW